MDAFAFEFVSVDRTGSVTARESGEGRRLVERLPGDLRLEMVWLAGGSFTMGSPAGQGYADERPAHRVEVAPFCLARALITQAQWEAVLGPGSHSSRCRGAARPVDSVSWHSAQRFCRRLAQLTGRAYRLPRESEWEHACRAGTTTPFSCGATITSDLANYNGEFTFAGEAKGIYRHESTEAGVFPPNPWGLYDMHGNLWEWCADPWHDDTRGAGPDTRRWSDAGAADGVLRGGSWHDTPDVCRSAARLRQERAAGDDLFGLRVALG